MIQKKFAIKSGDTVTEESHRMGYTELLQKYEGQDVEIYLRRYDASPSGIGWNFTSEARIGNGKDKLTRSEYYEAYDKII